MKWFKTLSFLCLLMSFSKTLGLEVFQDQGRIYLQSTECSTIQSHLQALRKWTNQMNPSNICTFSKVSGEDPHFCQYDISDCVPDHVQKYHGKNPYFPDPNCWNLTLVMNGILPALRFTNQEEAAFHVHSPLCHKVGKNERKQVGDIGAIRSKSALGSQEEVHAFIYISKELDYSKNGAWRVDPYELMPLRDIMEIYSVPSDEECEGTLSENSRCQISLSYFRCVSMQNYLEGSSDFSPDLISALQGMDDFEKRLQDRSINGSSISKKDQEKFVSVIEKILFSAQNELKKKKIKTDLQVEKRNFLLGSFYHRISSILDQLAYNKDRDLESQLSPLQKLLEGVVLQLQEN